MLDQIGQDLAYGARSIRRNVSFSLLVIGLLAIGIGANTAIYSVIDAVLLRKLPVTRPDELIALGLTENVEAFGNGTPGAIMYSYPLYRDVRDANTGFTGLVATGRTGRLDVRIDSGASEPEHPRGRFVSGNYFSLLGIPAAIGRTLGPADDLEDALPRATISYAYWASRFNRDPTVIGRSLIIDDAAVAITGVAAPGFDGEVVGSSTEIWLPVSSHDLLRRHEQILEDRSAMWLLLIGRAKPGLTLTQIRARVVPVIRASIFTHATQKQLRRLEKHEPEYAISSAARGLSRVRDQFGAALETLMAGVVLLLCIVCVNVANLLLARGVARRREVAVRLAMGASRWRVVRQMLTESVVVATVSAGVAVMAAWWMSRALLVVASGADRVALDVDPNGRVLLFALLLGVGSVLLFGLVPSFRASRVDVAASVRASGRSIASGSRFGASLIIAQVALSIVLLAGALSLARGLYAALSTDIGVDRDHIIVASVDIGKRGYTGDRLANLAHALTERIALTPGVAVVTLSENGLFDDTQWSTSIDVPEGRPTAPDDSLVSTDAVGAGYARGIGAHLLAGRDLTTQDEEPNTRSVLVNASFAQFYFPGQSAIGRRIVVGPRTAMEIVGVIADVRGQSLEAPAGHRARQVYYPFLHGNDTTRLGQPSQMRLLIRTQGAPETVIPSVRRAILAADGTLPIERVDALRFLIQDSIQEERLATQIMIAIGGLALVFAALGLFGVVSYSVARRTSEIGIRAALGARRADVAALVIREAMRPVALGIVIGLPLFLLSMRVLQHRLTIAPATDPVVIGGAISVLIVCTVAAALVPAHRASRIDPTEALRQE